MGKYQFRIGETEHGEPVKIDLETFISTRGVFIANSGGGKSFALRTIVEQTAKHVQWILIDPEGEYSSLRQMFPEMLLVAREGELPVDVRSAKLLARKIMENRVSTIIDLYGLLDTRAPWAAEFISSLINLPRDLWSPVIVAIDEAHRLAPETPTGNKAEREALNRSRRAIVMLADSGRKQSRGAIIASQRVSKLAADARAELRNRFIGLTVQDLDRDRAADDLGFTRAQARALRDLNAGEFYVYGPAFVNLKGIVKIKFDLPQTKHPRPGSQRLLDVPPASDALKLIVAQIGDLPAQAGEEARTLDAAQHEIAQLKQQLRARPVQMQTSIEKVVERVEVPVISDEQVQRLERALIQIKALDDSLQAGVNDVGKQLMQAYIEIGKSARQVHDRAAARPVALRASQSPHVVRASQPAARVASDGARLPKAERSILTVLAQYPDGRSNVQIAIMTGYAVTGGGFNNALGALRAAGYIHGDKTHLRITDAGLAALGNYDPLPAGRALLDYWLAHLPKAERAILSVVADGWPQSIDKAGLAERAGYEVSGGGFNNALGKLRTLELVSGRNDLRASDALFE